MSSDERGLYFSAIWLATVATHHHYDAAIKTVGARTFSTTLSAGAGATDASPGSGALQGSSTEVVGNRGGGPTKSGTPLSVDQYQHVFVRVFIRSIKPSVRSMGLLYYSTRQQVLVLDVETFELTVLKSPVLMASLPENVTVTGHLGTVDRSIRDFAVEQSQW